MYIYFTLANRPKVDWTPFNNWFREQVGAEGSVLDEHDTHGVVEVDDGSVGGVSGAFFLLVIVRLMRTNGWARSS